MSAQHQVSYIPETNFFFIMCILHAAQGRIQTISEHIPWWLSRFVTPDSLRQKKKSLLCIILELSKIALSNGYLALKIRWNFDVRIASLAKEVTFDAVFC